MLYLHAMKTCDFDFNLPKELIAQVPAPNRHESRLMVLDRKAKTIEHRKFYEVVNFLEKGDTLVTNNTKVIPARLIGKKEGINKPIEILLVKQITKRNWEALLKPQKKLKKGDKISFKEKKFSITVIKKNPGEIAVVELSGNADFTRIGFLPLPPYIKRDYTKSDFHETDKKRYQTIYAKNPGAIAAPTAGLHFTQELMKNIEDKGIAIAPLTLHVGIGTFKPIRTEYIKDHAMIPECYFISKETTNKLKKAKRIIAVGTTSVRTLEHATEGNGYTNLFIYPPYKFKKTNALITNFHLPKSSLFMLVSAFAGKNFTMKAYKEAIKNKYRFYSYGDAMLIL